MSSFSSNVDVEYTGYVKSESLYQTFICSPFTVYVGNLPNFEPSYNDLDVNSIDVALPGLKKTVWNFVGSNDEPPSVAGVFAQMIYMTSSDFGVTAALFW